MLRRVLALMGAAVMLMAVTAPASADPPPESGVVVRVEDPNGFGVFPDFVNGYWVFSNVTRDDFCQWFDDQDNEPFPTNHSPDQVQLVFASDALVVRVHAGGPTDLHAFAGDPFANPCDGSEPDAALSGDMRVTVNDNDGPNEGKRANSFGDRGRGTLHDDSGAAYRYSWNFRGVWNPDGTEFKVTTNKFNLHPIGG